MIGSVQAASVEMISTTSGVGPVLVELESPDVDPPSDPLLVVLLESAGVSVGSTPTVVDASSIVVAKPLDPLVPEPESESVAGTEVTDDIESLPRVEADVVLDVASSGVTQAPDSDP